MTREMTRERRESLAAVCVLLSKIDPRVELEEIVGALEDLRKEEQEYYGSMPKSLQSSKRGEAALSAMDAIEDAMTRINDAVEALAEAIDDAIDSVNQVAEG